MLDKTKQDDFSNIDKKLSIYFSALIFLLVGIIFITTAFYFNYLLHKEQNRLGSVIANSVGDSINRVSFSGKYQARLLVEDLKNKTENIDSIMIQEPSGMVIAHSSSDNNGKIVQDNFFEKAKKVMQTGAYAIQDITVNKSGENVNFIEIDIPYKKGQDNEIIGVTRVFLYADAFNSTISNALIFLGVFALCLSIIAYLIVQRLSNILGAPVKNLAYQLKGILKHTPLSISITNKEGDVLALSPLFEKLKDSVKSVEEESTLEQSAFAVGKVFNYNYTIKDGEKISYYHASKYPIALDENGQVSLVCTIAVDITEQKELELAITRQKEEFEALFFTSKDGMAILDLESNFLNFNDAYLEMTGFTRDELLSKSCISLTAPEDVERAHKALKTILENGFITNFERTYIIKNNKRIIVNMSAALLPDKKRLVISVKDVTKSKQFEQNLQALVQEETEKRLEKERLLAQQSKLAMMGEMIGNIAHQWRQPLNALALKVQDVPMALEFGELDDKYAENLKNESMTIIQYMSQTIDDFRNFFKPSKEKVKFSVCQSLKSIISIVGASLGASNIKLQIKDCDENLHIIGFPGELNQAIINIINNSKDALKERNVKNGLIELKVAKEGLGIVIKISDNGGGIAENIKDKIFEPYFTTKFASKGTGLGLYMTKMIAESMDGKVYVENGKDGAVFTIEIGGGNSKCLTN